MNVNGFKKKWIAFALIFNGLMYISGYAFADANPPAAVADQMAAPVPDTTIPPTPTPTPAAELPAAPPVVVAAPTPVPAPASSSAPAVEMCAAQNYPPRLLRHW